MINWYREIMATQITPEETAQALEALKALLSLHLTMSEAESSTPTTPEERAQSTIQDLRSGKLHKKTVERLKDTAEKTLRDYAVSGGFGRSS